MNKKNIIFTLFVIALIQVSYANEAEVTLDEGVIVLTQENFEQVIGQYEFVLVKFYAPWCGHCKTMAPAYAAASQHFSSSEHTRLGKVDATIHKDLATKYNVQGFPTLLFFQAGQKQEYKGGRTEQEIIQWVAKRSGPSSALLNSIDDIEQLKKKSKVAAVFFGDAESSMFSTFNSLSQQISDIDFAHVHNHDIISKIQPKGGINNIVLFKQFDDLRNDFEGDFKIDQLTSFINQNKMELFAEFGQDIAQAVFSDNMPCMFLFVKDQAQVESYRTIFSEVGKQIQGNSLVSYAIASEGFGKRLADYIGITEELCPTVRIVNNEKGAEQPQKFQFEGEINTENLLKFFKQFQDGQLKPFLKSEEIPAENNGNVKIVVAKNFDAIVLDQTKDVLIEFYAPWCGHCKKLEPIFEELGESMKSHSNIIIAKSDATANDIDGLGIESFPTIRFFPANNKALPGIDYTGDRTLEGFQKFLKEDSKTEQAEKKEEL